MNALKRILAATAVLAASFLPAIGLADTYDDGTYTWSYTVSDGKAIIKAGDAYSSPWQRAIEPAPEGEITIPSTLGGCPVTEIGYCAFVDCSQLTGVKIPDSVVTIGNYAFEYSGLTAVQMPDSVVSIGYSAFNYLRLTEVTIPSNVNYIGERAFAMCSQLATVTFAGDKSRIRIGANAFAGTPYNKTLPFKLVRDGTILIGIEGTPPAQLEIPAGITQIGQDVFNNCTELESVTIPEGVSSIGWNAFNGCSNLREVSLPDTLNAIDGYAFDGTSLESVTLPAGLQRMAYGSFSYTPLKTVYFKGNAPGDVSTDVYNGSPNVTNYVREGSVGWKDPDSTDLPGYWPTDGGEYNGRPILRWAGEPAITHTVTFDLGEHVSRTGGGALEQTVTGGTAADEPTVEADRGWVFCGWDADISCVTEDLTVHALYGREGAKADGSYKATVGGYTWSFVVTNGMAIIKSEYSWNSAINPYPYGEVEIPSELGGWPVRAIGEYAFRYCDGMTAVKIPETVNRIGQNAFSGCSGLKTLTIPASVTYMDGYSIDCSELSSVFFLGNAPAISSEGVFGWSTYATCFVRKGTTGWSSPGSSVLPEAWPLVGYNSQVIREWTTYPDVCYHVTFVLGEGATRAGGGELEQFVREGADAEEPTLQLNPGYEFVGWDADFTEVQGTVFVNAQYRKDGKLTDGYEYTEEANGYIWMFGIYEGEAFISEVVSPTPSGAVTIPSELGGWPVTEIGAYVFANCRQLTSVTIPASVEYIDAFAFRSCSSLTSFEVAADNEEYSSANGCLLTKDGKTLVLAPYAATVTVPDGVEIIGERAFESHDTLTAVELPSSLREIGYRAFAYCYNLCSVTLPKGLEEIGESAFNYCGFNSIIIPASVNYIGDYAFSTSGKASWLSIWYEGDCPDAGEYAYGSLWAGCCSYVRETAKGWDLTKDTWLGKPIKVWESYPDIGWDVTFDLGEYGTHTGGGELKQFVLDGEDAVAPQVKPDDGLEFYKWDCPFTDVTGPLTVKALYTKGGQPFGWIPLNDVDIIDLSDYEGEWLYEDGVLTSRYLEPAEFDVDEETGETEICDYENLWIEAETTKRGFQTFEFRCVDTNGNAVAADFTRSWDGEGPAISAGVGEVSGWQPVRIAIDGYLSLCFVNWSSSRCRVEIRNLQWEDPPEYVTIKLDPTLGALASGQSSELRLRTDGTYGDLPVPVGSGDLEFEGWSEYFNFDAEGGMDYETVESDYQVPMSGKTLYAIWYRPLESVVNPKGDLDELKFNNDKHGWWGYSYFPTDASWGQWKEQTHYSGSLYSGAHFDAFSTAFSGAGRLEFGRLTGGCGRWVEDLDERGIWIGEHIEYLPGSLQVLIDGEPVTVATAADGSARVDVGASGQHKLVIRLVNNSDESYYSLSACLNVGAITFASSDLPEGTYAITYLGLEGAVNTNVTTFTTNDLPLTLGPVEREGYKFLGWTPWDGVIPAGTASNVTFTALWEALANPDAPGVIVDPAPTADDVVPVKAEEVSAALAYNGYLAKGDEIVGSVTVKVAKKGKVTATVQLPDGSSSKALKKFSYAGTLGENGSVALSCKKNGGTMSVTIGAKALSGTVAQGGETYAINGRLGTKDALSSVDSLLDKKVWSIALHTPSNGVPHALVNGYSVLTVTGGKKGKVKVSGFLADGTKVSVSAQGTVFDSCVIVPVNAALYKGKAGGFSLKLKIEDEKFEVGNVSDWTAVVDGKPVTVKWDAVPASAKSDIGSGATFHMDAADIPFDVVPPSADGTSTLPDGVKVDSVGGKWSLPKAGKVAFTKDKSDLDVSKFGENPAGLKLSYAAKTGAFKGSFSLYRQTAPGKLKKEKATVNGVVVNGVGYGSAVIKKTGSMPVTVK